VGASLNRRATNRARKGTPAAYAMNTAAVAPSNPHEPLTARICAPAMSSTVNASNGTGSQAVNRSRRAHSRDRRITGWRRNHQLVGRPDFVFPKVRVAVFVDGCFWHGCPKYLRMPSDNRTYWLRKIERNQARDRVTVCALRSAGWRVLRIWEHELRFTERVAHRLIKALSAAPARARIRRSPKEIS
jgi:DNA mismatch endonuclease, patch repair protein